MLPFVVGAVASWSMAGFWREEVSLLTGIWGGSILAFLAGVRRGLSFRTEGGPAIAQIATMFCVFVLAMTALVFFARGVERSGTALLFVGFVALAVLDPIAARRGQVPLFFARLRPPQLAIAIVSLAGMLARAWMVR